MRLTPEIIDLIKKSEWYTEYRKGKMCVSPSSTNGWQCPTKFILSKVLGLEKVDQDKSKADFGKAFHSFLETGTLAEDASPDLRLLASDYDAKKDKRMVVNERELEFFHDLPRAICPKIEIHGIVDGIGTYDGIPCVIEHKTTSSTNLAGFIESKCNSIQAMAYLWHTGLRSILFNVIQRKRDGGCNVITRFHQVTDDEIEDWTDEVMDISFSLKYFIDNAVENGFSTTNRELCHQPYNCQFCDFCQASLENKNKTIETLYKTKEIK